MVTWSSTTGTQNWIIINNVYDFLSDKKHSFFFICCTHIPWFSEEDRLLKKLGKNNGIVIIKFAFIKYLWAFSQKAKEKIKVSEVTNNQTRWNKVQMPSRKDYSQGEKKTSIKREKDKNQSEISCKQLLPIWKGNPEGVVQKDVKLQDRIPWLW